MHKNSLTLLALICSLLVNAFLGGYVFSSFFRPFMPPPMPFERMENATRILSPEHRERVRALIEDHQRSVEQHMAGMRSEFDRIQSILTAPTFDADALRTIQKDLKNPDRAKIDMLSLLIDIAQSLPDKERIQFFTESEPPRPPFPH